MDSRSSSRREPGGRGGRLHVLSGMDCWLAVTILWVSYDSRAFYLRS